MEKKIPAISIVTPMYNAEKFIADCLDSVLAQNFTDYEIVVVDDCSTDNSRAIVESYLPKFGGKLKFIRTQKNSTNPSTPRNIGINLSCGEYILFLDSDDAITPTALEEVHNLITKFKADVIHFEKYYLMDQENVTKDKNLLEIKSWKSAPPFVDSPTFWTDDISKRMELFLKGEIAPYTWSHVVRRDLLIQCNIIFPPMRIAGDHPYSIHLLCEAKTFLRVPNIFYVYRIHQGSQSDTSEPMEKWVHHRVYSVFCGLNYLIKLMDNVTFFIEHPEFKYNVLDVFVARQIYDIGSHYQHHPLDQMDYLIQQEIRNIYEDKTALTSFLFSRMSLLSAIVENQHNLIQKLSNRISQQDISLQKLMEVIQTQNVQIKQRERQLEELKKV